MENKQKIIIGLLILSLIFSVLSVMMAVSYVNLKSVSDKSGSIILKQGPSGGHIGLVVQKTYLEEK